MIELDSKKYRKVLIFEKGDVKFRGPNYSPVFNDTALSDLRCSHSLIHSADVIAYVDFDDRKVKLMKSRFGFDREIENFVLSCNVQEAVEIFDPIYSRFEILDL